MSDHEEKIIRQMVLESPYDYTTIKHVYLAVGDFDKTKAVLLHASSIAVSPYAILQAL